MGYAILAALIIAIGIGIALFSFTYKIFRNFEVARFKSSCLSVATLFLLAVCAWACILTWSSPSPSTIPPEQMEEYERMMMEEGMRASSENGQ